MLIPLTVNVYDATRIRLGLVADQPLSLDADRFSLIESFAVDADNASCI
jgi:hypothetical protein